MNVLGNKEGNVGKGTTPLEASKISRTLNTPETPRIADGSKFVVSLCFMLVGNKTSEHNVKRITSINRTGWGNNQILSIDPVSSDLDGELVLSQKDVMDVIAHVKEFNMIYGPKVRIQAVA
jgi:hypothetical protein